MGISKTINANNYTAAGEPARVGRPIYWDNDAADLEWATTTLAELERYSERLARGDWGAAFSGLKYIAALLSGCGWGSVAEGIAATTERKSRLAAKAAERERLYWERCGNQQPYGARRIGQ